MTNTFEITSIHWYHEKVCLRSSYEVLYTILFNPHSWVYYGLRHSNTENLMQNINFGLIFVDMDSFDVFF